MSKNHDKNSASCKNSQSRTKKMNVMNAMVDKPEEETIKANFAQRLEGMLKSISIYLEDDDLKSIGFRPTTGVLYCGKPGLGVQAQKYLERHARDLTVVFPRHVATLTTQLCEDTFKRAVCCAPCIMLFIGLEDAAPDVEAVIARIIKDVADSSTFAPVLATTAMYGQVSEKLRACFCVEDLEELAASTHQD